MGQYRLWLHHREIDLQLQVQLEMLEKELAQLQERAYLLGREHCNQDNVILQALLQRYSQEVSSTQISEVLPEQNSPQAEEAKRQEDSPRETISPALHAWSQLPNFDAQQLHQPMIQDPTFVPLPTASHIQPDLLPADMSAFIDAHTQVTSPQIEALSQLRDLALPPSNEQSHQPIDQQSVRTNRLIQRWFERWGRLAQNQQRSQEEHVR